LLMLLLLILTGWSMLLFLTMHCSYSSSYLWCRRWRWLIRLLRCSFAKSCYWLMLLWQLIWIILIVCISAWFNLLVLWTCTWNTSRIGCKFRWTNWCYVCDRRSIGSILCWSLSLWSNIAISIKIMLLDNYKEKKIG
jgi:hypothetical protein